MSLKTFTTNFRSLGQEKTFRYDVDFADFQHTFLAGKYYSFDELFSFSTVNHVNIEDLEDDFLYSEITNVSKEGVVDPVKLNFTERNEEEESYYKKIEKGDIIQVQENNILLSKVRPNLKKFVFVNEDNKNIFFTSAFIHLKPKKLSKILYYALRTVFYNNLIAISRQGKGYPTLKEDDFLSLKFNKYIIDKLLSKQEQLATEIELLEGKIKKLKSQIKKTQDIINAVFAREFRFDIKEVSNIEGIKYFFANGDNTYRNYNLRSSVRWNKIKPIQKALYRDNPYIEKLSNYILATKNGWSPNCKETDTENCVFGVNSISKDGRIKYDDVKYSDEIIPKISDYFVKENDLFVSRGNTVDLVALAAVARNVPEDRNFIFPDLFIRIDVDPQKLVKDYLALLFNSVIGRYYFKYSAKGKNQTMVKVSSDELNNFYLPIPPLKLQQKIVDEIKAELEKQDEYNEKIATERAKIDEIIENSVK